MLDLDHLGAHGGKEASGAGAGQHPAQIDDPDIGQGEGLAMLADNRRLGPAFRGDFGHGRRTRLPVAQHLLRMLAQQRRAGTPPPGDFPAYPFRANIGEASVKLGMIDIKECLPRRPMRITHILLRTADRRPGHPLILTITPQFG